MQQEAYGEVFLINKPLEWTSFDVVKKVRNALRIKKVGHAGTLDPLATGLLIVCTGKMTKQIETYMGQEKEYTGTFVIGATTESFDLEKSVLGVADPSHISLEDIKKDWNHFFSGYCPNLIFFLRIDQSQARKIAETWKN